MHSKKSLLLARTTPSQHNIVVNTLWLTLVIVSLLHIPHTLAMTNAAGVEIEIIENDSSDISGDPLKTFINNTDTENALADIGTSGSDEDLWARIKSGYAMPDIDSEYTAKHENWYSSRPDYVRRMIERSQKYLFHIVEEVQKRGMPTEIALLPMIESAYNPQAYSRSHASGIWQFVPSTGKNYGLKQNHWVDNRRDITAATDAALNYLQKLYGMFGTWDLALAAYNAGEGTVQRAIERNRRAGLPTDYQNLKLPPETRNYVPKLQAIKNIVTEPERFGLSINSIPNRAYFTEVSAPKQIDAKLAAQLAEISIEEFNALNPSYNLPVITAQGEVHQFLLPTWASERFTTNLQNYDKPLTNWQTYSAKRGERMDSIAKKFGIGVSRLREVNNLPNTKKFRTAQPLLVPVKYANNSDSNETNSQPNLAMEDSEVEPTATAAVTHKVERGDTLHAISQKYDVDTHTLIKINGLKSAKLKTGQIIRLSSDTSTISPRKILTSYKGKKYRASSKTRSRINSSSSSQRRIKTYSNIRLR